MPHNFHNILIRMPNWLGDAVMATPLIADLRAAWPQARLTALCQGAVSSLLIGNPHLDEIVSFNRPNNFLFSTQQRELIKQVRQGHYDLGILMTNSFSSAWWLWRGRVERRLGFAGEGRRFLLTDPLPFPQERGKEHLVITYKRLLQPLGISLSSTPPSLYVTEEEMAAAQERLTRLNVPSNALLVGINPGAAYGSAKCWLPERFREVIEKLLKHPEIYILCFGDKAGADLVQGICKEMPSRVLNLAAATQLRELMALIKTCALFLTNDSGPMHIAAALKTPLVALFGSTNAIATGPYQHGHIIHKHVACSPCYRRTCPIDFRCMKRIEADEVYSALINQLPSKKRRNPANY